MSTKWVIMDLFISGKKLPLMCLKVNSVVDYVTYLVYYKNLNEFKSLLHIILL